MPLLRSGLALAILLRAAERHGWTFAGLFAWKASPEGFELTLLNNPVSRTIRADQPVCDYDAATFETLFRGLAGPSTRVEETACTAKGDAACMFRVTL